MQLEILHENCFRTQCRVSRCAGQGCEPPPASRRQGSGHPLRRPREPRALSLDHTRLLLLLDNERFYSTIISLKVGDTTQAAILKDVQRHPAKNAVLHVDLQRVLENEKIRMTIPLHFKGAAASPGVKTAAAWSRTCCNDVEVTCLPKDLPEFLELDLSQLKINELLHLSDIKVPEGVEIIDLAHGRDEPVVSVHHPRAEEVETPAAALRLLRPRRGARPLPAAGATAAPAADAKPGKDAKDAKK